MAVSSSTMVPPSPRGGKARASGSDSSSPPDETSLAPFDNDLKDNVVFDDEFYSEITLSLLESDDAIEHDLNFKYIDLIILRIINPPPSSVANVYTRRLAVNKKDTMKFSRLFLAKVYSSKNTSENTKLVYMIQSKNVNENLWNMNLEYRDNGVLSIGTFIRFISPSPVEKYMRGDIPMLHNTLPVVILKPPKAMANVAMQTQIEGNTSLGFVFIGMKVSSLAQSAMKTTCSGKLCDRQRISDWQGSRGCGCFKMFANSTSLVLQHHIRVKHDSDKEKVFNMSQFSSLKFDQLFLSKEIPGVCKLRNLQLTRAFLKISKCIKLCTKYINDNGGFTIFGWYKRGEITDKSLMEANAVVGLPTSSNANEEGKVQSGEISHHFVHITPTNPMFNDPTSEQAKALVKLKYDVTKIEEEGKC